MTERDAEQVRRARAGDRAAYGALVDAYQGMVFATALNITGNYSDAEDVVQDAFLRAFERLATLVEPAKFPAWLRTLTVRSALTLLRRRRHVSASILDEPVEEQAAGEAESPAEAYARAEFARLLWREVGELPPKTREAVLLFYMEGYSVSRAATYLGCSEGALKARLHFGREKLREALLEQVEAELRGHRPTEKTRNAVIAALPASLGGSSTVLVPGKESLPVLLTLTPLTVGLTACVVLFMAGLAALALWPEGPSPGTAPVNPPPVISEATVEPNPETGPPEAAQDVLQTLQAAVGENVRAETGCSISGRVIDADTGDGVAGVGLSARGGETRVSTSTDASGVYRFDGLPAQRYRVFCGKAKGYYEPEHGELQEVELGENQHFEGLDFALQAGVFASLSGTVLHPDGAPAAGVKVTAVKDWSAPGRSQSAECMTANDGTYTIEELPVGTPLYVKAGAPGFHSRSEGPLLLPVEGARGVTIHLYPAGSISGVVVDKSGRPISDTGIGVKAERWERLGINAAIYEERTTTREDGTFVLAELQAGGYLLWAETEGTMEIWSGGFTVEPDPADLVQVNEGQHVTGVTVVFDYATYQRNREAKAQTPPSESSEEVDRIERSMWGAIEGQVVRAGSGEPVTAYRLSTNADGRYAEAVNDPEGRFRIEESDQAQTTLHVTAAGFAPAKTVVERPEGPETAVQVTIRLETACSVEGTVVDWDGDPVAGTVIYLDGLGNRDAYDSNREDARAKADGTFRLESLAPGAHRLYAVHPDFAFAWAEVDVRPGRPATVTIPLARGGNIEGVVTRDGEPAGEVLVRALADSLANCAHLQDVANELVAKQITRLYASTDPSGAYALTNLPPGRYLVAADSEFDAMQERAMGSESGGLAEAIVEPGLVTRVDVALPSNGG